MKVDFRLPIALSLLTPAAAFAIEGPVEVFMLAAGGGAAGGFLGALIACWLCKRMGSRRDDDQRR